MEKKSNTLWIVAGVILLIAVVAGGIIVFSPNGHTVQNVNSANTQAGKTLFSSSPDYQYAYQIYPGALSETAKKALTGFNMTVQNASDGTTIVRLIAINSEYHNETYNLQSGDKLYFVEKSWGDDRDGQEKFLGDDFALVVNSQGYIVNN